MQGISMRIISVGRLKAFWEQSTRREAEHPLRAWVKVVRAAEWRNPPAIKRMFNSAGILPDGRVVFDIAGNKYRLVARVNFDYGVVCVRFIGTLRQYDAIDAQTI
jgi:mRNA interferase HigB